MSNPLPTTPEDLRTLVKALEDQFIKEIGHVCPGVPTKRFDAHSSHGERLISPKRGVDEANITTSGISLESRIYIGAVCPALELLIDHVDHKGKPERIDAGVWVDKEAYLIKFFAWVEVYRPDPRKS